MPRLNTSLLQRPPPGNRFRQPSWKIGISKDARTSEPTMATVPAAARGPRYFTVPWRPRRLREALVEPGYEMREETRRLGVEEPDHRHRRFHRRAPRLARRRPRSVRVSARAVGLRQDDDTPHDRRA